MHASLGSSVGGDPVFGHPAEIRGTQLPTNEALGNPPNRLRALLGLPAQPPRSQTHLRRDGGGGVSGRGDGGLGSAGTALYADAFALDARESLHHVFDWSRYSIVSKLPPIPDPLPHAAHQWPP